MNHLSDIYRTSLGLLTDLYQLTMAYGYWKHGLADREAVFHLTFRKHPFDGQFAIACGLAQVIDLLDEFRFSLGDREYLASLRGADERPLFERGFLDYLGQLEFQCDVDAIPEGTAVFAHEPLVRVTGPLLQAQVIETALLNFVNFQTLVATKAARICNAAQGDPVIEFGLRRAQGIDGGLTASRAAYIGGCVGTSNVLSGKLFGIPVKGTHAHSWVMSFDHELESFEAYARAMPNNCVFLVDTFDTIEGVHNAVKIGESLRLAGHGMLGVRLDSGDLSELSKQARAILDDAGFTDAAIVASNDLDERAIQRLKADGAKINVWGVGTKLATAYDQPALGGVYKLSAIRCGDRWEHKLKLSEEPIKISTPGRLQVRRFREGGQFVGDILWDELSGISQSAEVTSFEGAETWLTNSDGEDLLVPIYRSGKLVYESPSIQATRMRRHEQLRQLDEGVTRFDEPIPYRVGLERGLDALKQELIAAAEGGSK
jgi:nicotinate phosphoribosyltransferase